MLNVDLDNLLKTCKPNTQIKGNKYQHRLKIGDFQSRIKYSENPKSKNNKPN